MSPTLSIVICTYNRADWLETCLASLEPQCQDGSRVEVIVVDNNSTDETKQISGGFCGRSQNFRYVFEEKQGLSHARNRGMAEASGAYVAYIDDDARASADWVEQVFRFFAANPGATAVGGPYKPFSTVVIPNWFPVEYGGWHLGYGTRLTSQNEWINGTNMIFRKQALIDVGGFDTSIGMSGTTVSYGEETNLQLRLRARNLSIYYCDAILVEHAILPHKFSLRWLLKSSFANGYDAKQTFCHNYGVMRYLLTVMKAAANSLFILITSREPYLKTRLYRSGAPVCWHLGNLKRLVGL